MFSGEGKTGGRARGSAKIPPWGVGFRDAAETYQVMRRKSESLDPDLAARFDQELAELQDVWISQLPAENRPPLQKALLEDPFLTHQVFALVVDLLPHQSLRFLNSAAKNLGEAPPAQHRPILSGLLALGSWATP